MAKSRSIPTDLLSDPDYMELDSDTQVILLMLVLTADDEGRGRAHTGMLARHFNKPLERIEHALAQLSELELVTCYIVGRHHYYQLLRWWDWQTLSKPTPSRFPLPPAKVQPNASAPCSPRETQENPGASWPEGEGKGIETEQKQEAESDLPAGITRFPHLPSPAANFHGSGRLSLPTPTVPFMHDAPLSSQPPDGLCSLASSVQQIATILHLPVTEALTRVITDYTTFGALALQGCADAAREWIDDPTRNRSQKRMSVAFFRRWLDREQDIIAARQHAREQQATWWLATGTSRSSGSFSSRGADSLPEGRPRLPSLTHLVEEDQHVRGACS